MVANIVAVAFAMLVRSILGCALRKYDQSMYYIYAFEYTR
jgi:hypothetical protein